MSTKKRKLFLLGEKYWYQYVNLFGYMSKPEKSFVKFLSVQLNVNYSFLFKCISTFLNN